MRWGLAVAGVLVLLAAEPALAARVETVRRCHEGPTGNCVYVDHAVFVAADGEANRLGLSYADGRFTFRDAVPIEAGPGCESRSPFEVACAASTTRVDLRDGDDEASAESLPTTGSPVRPFATIDGGFGADRLVSARVGPAGLLGGPGDDDLDGASGDGGTGDDRLRGSSLVGGPGRDRLEGTEGNDFLTGGPDEDELIGAAGDDNLTGDGGDDYDERRAAQPGTDVLDGGPGADAVSYHGHHVRVTVDLAAGAGGSSGEGDTIRGVEHASGGEGDDRLVGDEGPNRLTGGTHGDDAIFGAGGDDRLDGVHQHDHLDAGAGNDHVNGGPGHDSLEGGDGDDWLSGQFDVDRIDAGAGDDHVIPDVEEGRAAESIACGDGEDLVQAPGKAFAQPDCESVRLRFLPPLRTYPEARPDGRLVFRFSCPKPRACSGRIWLRLLGGPRAALAPRAWSSRSGQARVAVPIPAAVRERTESPLRVEATLHVRQRVKPYNSPDFVDRWTFDLRQVR